MGVWIPFGTDKKAYDKGLKDMRRSTETWSKSIKKIFTGALSVFGGMALYDGFKRAMNGLFLSIGKGAMSAAADMEKLMVSFEVMMGSAEAAKKFARELEGLAASTPLQMVDLAKQAQLLKGYGIATDDLIPTLRMLGDVSRGDAEALAGLSKAYGEVFARGELRAQEKIQMINHQLNIFGEISKRTGESVGQLADRMEKGNITFDEVRETLIASTSAGGGFFNMLEKQSKTTHGLWSTLNDAIQKVLRVLGKPINEWLKPWLQRAIDKAKELATAIQKAVEQNKGIELLTAGLAAAGEAFGIALKKAVNGALDLLYSGKLKRADPRNIGEALDKMDDAHVARDQKKLTETSRKIQEDYLKSIGVLDKDGKVLRGLSTMSDAEKKGHDEVKKLARKLLDAAATLEGSLSKHSSPKEEETPAMDKFNDLLAKYNEDANEPEGEGDGKDKPDSDEKSEEELARIAAARAAFEEREKELAFERASLEEKLVTLAEQKAALEADAWEDSEKGWEAKQKILDIDNQILAIEQEIGEAASKAADERIKAAQKAAEEELEARKKAKEEALALAEQREAEMNRVPTISVSRLAEIGGGGGVAVAGSDPQLKEIQTQTALLRRQVELLEQQARAIPLNQPKG